MFFLLIINYYIIYFKNMKKFNIPKYIHKLKQSKLPSYLVGQESGSGLKEIYHPGKHINKIIKFN
jgi:hypothetical protein